MSIHAFLCRLRPTGVEGSGIARRRIAAAVSFWLALSKASGFSTPSSTRVRSRAMRPASRAPAPRLVFERGAQLLCLLTLLLKLGFKLPELLQLCLLQPRVRRGGRSGRCRHYRRRRRGTLCVWHVIFVILQLDEEALSSGIIIHFAGVVEAGEAVVRRSLKRHKSIAIADSRVVPLRAM